MKKNILVSSLIALLCVPTIVGCDLNVSSSNQITSSSTDEITTNNERLNNMLTALRKGFTFEGDVKQTKHKLDGYYGNYTGEEVEVNYEAEFIYEMSEENGYSTKITSNCEGDIDEVLNLQVFEGEDGYAYYYELNYDNTVLKYPIIGVQTYEKVNFGYYCMNPFEYLIPSDFTKTGENTFTLSNTKASFFASTVLVDVNSAFIGKINFCEFTLEGDTLKSFKVIPNTTHVGETDYEYLTAVYYMCDFEANFEVKDIGTAKVQRVQPKEHKPEHDALQAAFAPFACNNFTAYLYIEYTDEKERVLGENFLWYYYDGSKLFLSAKEDQTEYDSLNDMYVSGFDPLLHTPIIADAQAEIFDYDAENDIYVLCEEMVSYIGAIAFVPYPNTIQNELNGYTDSFEIKLASDGSIDYIHFTYTFENILYTEYADAIIEFYNVGTTTAPAYLG